jgi:hypothetical protein
LAARTLDNSARQAGHKRDTVADMLARPAGQGAAVEAARRHQGAAVEVARRHQGAAAQPYPLAAVPEQRAAATARMAPRGSRAAEAQGAQGLARTWARAQPAPRLRLALVRKPEEEALVRV